MTTRPIIGVTGPDRGGSAAWTFTRLSVRLAGGKALRITPSSPHPIDEIDGLILGGGADVDPQRYGQSRGAPEEESATDPSRPWYITLFTWLLSPIIIVMRKLDSVREPTINRERDELEGNLLALAIERDMPILGICRGSQFINVHFGGTLFQDIQDFYQEELKRDSVYPRKKVRILPGSRLATILNCEWCRVNSLHNQAADDLGEGIEIVAHDKSGVTQALEHKNHTFVVGVQWHPEYLIQLPEQRRLFKRLVHEAQAFSEASIHGALGKKERPIKDLARQSRAHQSRARQNRARHA